MILEWLKNPVVLAIVAYIAITLITGGKLDFQTIRDMLLKIINPTAAAAATAERKRLEDREQAADELEKFISEGDTEGEQLARKRLDRLIKRGK